MSHFQQKIAIERELKLHDLFKEWGQRTRAVQKLEATVHNCNRGTAKASLLARLTGWINQLTHLKDKESDTLSQICNIESTHKLLRKQNKLCKPLPIKENIPKQEAKKKPNLWFWVLLFLLLRQKKKQRPFMALQNG